MKRCAAVVVQGLLLVAGVHLRHALRTPSIDYVGLAIASAASAAGVPGPGEPVLIAEAIFAARHDLDISLVVVVAWFGATVGGVVGWLIGQRFGRRVLTIRGPLHAMRVRAVTRGEAVFARRPVLAVILTPSWVAGILRVRASVYHPANALAAALWAAPLGLGAYYAGPPVVDFISDAGTAVTVALVVLVAAGAFAGLRRRHVARSRDAGEPS
jgi:membrane protein DedA with SNARE-associated domain